MRPSRKRIWWFNEIFRFEERSLLNLIELTKNLEEFRRLSANNDDVKNVIIEGQKIADKLVLKYGDHNELNSYFSAFADEEYGGWFKTS